MWLRSRDECSKEKRSTIHAVVNTGTVTEAMLGHVPEVGHAYADLISSSFKPIRNKLINNRFRHLRSCRQTLFDAQRKIITRFERELFFIVTFR